MAEATVAKSETTTTPVAPKTSNYKSAFRGQSLLRRKQIQYALKNLGFYYSGIDGLWGKGTSSAIVDYAQSNGVGGISPNGVFHSVLSKVDVPNSFAAPKRLVTKTELFTEYACSTNKIYIKTPMFEISTNKGMTSATLVEGGQREKLNSTQIKTLLKDFKLDQAVIIRFFEDNTVKIPIMDEQKALSDLLKSKSPKNRTKLKKRFEKIHSPKPYQIRNNVASWSQKMSPEPGMTGTVLHTFDLATNQYFSKAKAKISSVGETNAKVWASYDLN